MIPCLMKVRGKSIDILYFLSGLLFRLRKLNTAFSTVLGIRPTGMLACSVIMPFVSLNTSGPWMCWKDALQSPRFCKGLLSFNKTVVFQFS